MTYPDLSQFDGQLIDGLDFCARVYAFFELIRSADNGPSRLRMRTSCVEKKLIEELFPICKYIQTKYRAGRYISVRWFKGSQSFDAEIIQAGECVELGYFPAFAFLEITCVMHPNEYLSRELINTKGGAFGLEGIRRLKNREIESIPVTYKNQNFVELYSQLVVEQIRKKESITYPPETTLIVQCSLNNLYLPEEWEAMIVEVRNKNLEHQFREIFIYDPTADYSSSL